MKGLYEPLGGNHYQKIREKFCQAIKKDSTAVFCSNKQIVYSADSTLPFEQSRDLFYLCGIDQENTFLILSPNNPNPELREVLFIEKSTQQSLIWEGRKLTKKQAQKLSGIETIFWSEDFEKISKQILGKSKNIYLNQNDHPRNSAPIELDFSFLFNQQIKKKFPKAKYILADEILKNLRSIKTKVEIKQIQTAGKITEIGYKKVLPLL
ncbi:MAG: X-Pro aminopeptidase, partial [Flavobacteriaceae bacterium]